MPKIELSDIISIILTTIFGIAGWIYAHIALRNSKKQHLLEIQDTNKKLETSKKNLNAIQEKLDEAKYAIPKEFKLLPNVHDALEKLNQIIKERALINKAVEVKIFGLDLQTITPWLITKVIHDDLYNNTFLKFRFLIIDPEDNLINSIIDEESDISKDAIFNSIQNAKAIDKIPDVDRFDFELRKYSMLPIIHGFMVDDEFLGLAFTKIENSKLYGGIYPYFYLYGNTTSALSNLLFGVYKSWFEFYWEHSLSVVNIKK